MSSWSADFKPLFLWAWFWCQKAPVTCQPHYFLTLWLWASLLPPSGGFSLFKWKWGEEWHLQCHFVDQVKTQCKKPKQFLSQSVCGSKSLEQLNRGVLAPSQSEQICWPSLGLSLGRPSHPWGPLHMAASWHSSWFLPEASVQEGVREYPKVKAAVF